MSFSLRPARVLIPLWPMLSLEQLEYIERIDRLTTIAENRRNALLNEIERRRALFGATLRRSVQEIEDGEFEVIETTPAKGKNAA